MRLTLTGKSVIFLVALSMLIMTQAAIAADVTVNMLIRNHFVPEYDQWLAGLAKQFEAETGIRINIDSIRQDDLTSRLTIEIATQSGHDIVELMTPYSPVPMFENHLVDVTDSAEALGGRFGGWAPLGESYANRNGVWRAIPVYFVDHPTIYRRDLFASVGMMDGPETWDDVLRAGAALRSQGHPVGIPLSHGADATQSLYSLLWSFGASVVAEDGTTITLDSQETRNALLFVKELFDRAMTPEVLSWDDAGNNRFMLSGRGAWTENAISVYNAAKNENPELAARLWHKLPPSGPGGTYGYGSPYAYGIWKFSKNIEPAKQWLAYIMEHFADGFRASQGYNQPLLLDYAKPPMPILSEDPQIAPLQDYAQIARTAGFPGPVTNTATNLVSQYVIPDMFARVATGTSVDAAVQWAVEQVRRIYGE